MLLDLENKRDGSELNAILDEADGGTGGAQPSRVSDATMLILRIAVVFLVAPRGLWSLT